MLKNRKYLYCFLMLIALVVITASSVTAETTLAVLGFKVNSANEELKALGDGPTDMLISELDSARKLKIVERSRLNEALNEMGLSKAGILDESNAAQLGRAVGADSVVLGSVTDLAGTLIVNIRVVSVETGEVKGTAKAQGNGLRELPRMIESTARDILSLLTYSLTGKITDSKGKGVEDVTISFGGTAGTVKTDHYGKWEAAGFDGSVTIVPSLEGWAFAPKSITAAKGGTSYDFTASQIPYTLSGKVTDPDGKRLSGIEIRFSDGANPVTTDINGRWFKEGQTGTVDITPVSDLWTFSPVERTVGNRSDSIDFKTLPAPYRIWDRVVDTDGNGVSGVVMNFGSGLTSVSTDETGYWEKDGLTGEYTVTPYRPGWTFNPSVVTISRGFHDLNIIATPKRFTASGTVKDENGNGIAGIILTFSNGFGSVVTSADGTWSKTELYGSVDIIPNNPDYWFAPSDSALTEENNSETFIARPMEYTASGRVTGPNGKALPNIMVDFSDGTSTVTDESGNWSRDGLIGSVTVSPTSVGYTYTPAKKAVTRSDPEADFTAKLADFKISGRVTDDSGKGLPGVQLRINGELNPVTTDSNGNWQLSGATKETIITPFKDGYVFSPTSLRVASKGPQAVIFGLDSNKAGIEAGKKAGANANHIGTTLLSGIAGFTGGILGVGGSTLTAMATGGKPSDTIINGACSDKPDSYKKGFVKGYKQSAWGKSVISALSGSLMGLGAWMLYKISVL